MEVVSFYENQENKSLISLVFSPHPDDDVIGMGGMIAKIAKIRPVWSVYATDGAGSLRKEDPTTIVASREIEAKNALQCLGGSGAFFMRATSRNLLIQEEFSKNLEWILLHYNIHSIFVTSPFERHVTHLRTTEWFLQVFKKIPMEKKKDWQIFGYSVWGNIIAPQQNIVVEDISEYVDCKEGAILCHKGEIEYKAYHSGVLARNFYEAIYENPHSTAQASHVEIFLKMDAFLYDPLLSLKEFAQKQSQDFYNHIYKMVAQ